MVRTPFRVSFAGGGTDLPAYYGRRGRGAVISAAIKRFTYVILHPKFDSRIRIFHYDGSELADDATAVAHEFFRAALLETDVKTGLELAVISDVPGRGTGLGSSASLTVGLLHALSEFLGQSPTRVELAERACHLEIDVLQSPVGKQDQYAVAIGGLNFIVFHDDGSVDVHPIEMPKDAAETLQRSLMAFNTGISRKTKDILRHVYAGADEPLLESLDVIRGQAGEMRDVLEQGDLDGFVRLLDEGWQVKRALAKSVISQPVIDDAYARARRAGARAGKLCGAGGGGFLLLYVEEQHQPAVREALADFPAMPIAFDFAGTQTIFAEERP